MNIALLLNYINENHRMALKLLKRYTDGEQGAYGLLDQKTGQQFVLKWHGDAQTLSRLQQVASIVAQLVACGYPVPIYILQGEHPEGTYTLQAALAGSPLYELQPQFLPRLLALNEMQREMGSGKNDWPREVVETVLFGGKGYCQHESLLAYSEESRKLLLRLQAIVSANKDAIESRDDCVHFDFQPYNILVQGAEVSGVVDWEGCRAGDRVFDLATLLFYAYDAVDLRTHLWEYILENTALSVASVYLAHLILRQVDWSLRYHEATEGLRYLRRAQVILKDLV